jgi:hypothetical protein
VSQNGVYIRVLLVVVALVILVAFFNRTSHPTPRDPWLPSSFNPVGAGELAFYQTLDELHWPVARWREPFSRLAAEGTGNVLIITRSHVSWRVAFTAQEAELLDDWVKRGNTLFLLGPMAKWDDSRLLLEEIGFTVPHDAAEGVTGYFPGWNAPVKPVAIPPTPGSNEIGTLVEPPAAPLPITYPAGAKTLWSESGQPYVIDVPRGKGHVVCAASAQVLSNAYLGQGDNLSIVLGLLAPNGQVPRHLFFEESHHGYTAVYAIARLIDHPGVRFAALLGLLGLATFLGSAFVRFGPILPLHREAGRSALEFVDSIAELYHRSDLRNEMIRFLFDETHRHILARLNLPVTAPHELISSRLQQTHPGLPSWKKLAHRFNSQDYVAGLPPTGWLRVARELMQIKAALA